MSIKLSENGENFHTLRKKYFENTHITKVIYRFDVIYFKIQTLFFT